MLQPKPVFLKDYQPPAFRVENIDLEFDIRSISNVRITANTQFKRHDHGAKLILDGNPELVHIQSIALDGVELKEDQYQLTSEHKLEIPAVPRGVYTAHHLTNGSDEKHQLHRPLQLRGHPLHPMRIRRLPEFYLRP
jgi:aminopeptidase N